ncbi:MAG: tol-pal system protein YbgF, partial [Desulfovibrionaceae bacterium]
SRRLDALDGGGIATASLPAVAADVAAIKFALQQQLALDIMPVAPTPAPAPTGVVVPAQPGVQPEGAQAAAQPGEAPAAAPAVTSTDPAQALYDRAYAAFGQKQYDLSRQLFAEFTTTFKKHALAPNAIFWQGQAYFELGDYQRAILAYQDVIKNYPQSPKFKHAMLKQGIAFYRLGKKDLGKIVLDELVKKYPESTEATRAKQFMSEN